MKRTTVLVDEPLLVEVKQLGDAESKSFTEIVQEALREYVRTHRGVRKPITFAGIGRSGRQDVSALAEEMLDDGVEIETGWS